MFVLSFFCFVFFFNCFLFYLKRCLIGFVSKALVSAYNKSVMPSQTAFFGELITFYALKYLS